MPLAEKDINTSGSESLALLNFLKGLGGTQQNSSSTTSVDPKFLDGLKQILGTQLGQTTPEGAAKLIQDIFLQGSKAAPGLATQLAGAAGARSSNNSPLATGNIQLQAELTSKATQALAGLQSNASTTASNLAQAAPKTQTQSQTTGASKSGMALTALPFLLAQSGKLKGLKDSLTGFFGSGSVPLSIGSGSGSGSTVGAVNDMGVSSDMGAGNYNGANWNTGDLAAPVNGAEFLGSAPDGFTGPPDLSALGTTADMPGSFDTSGFLPSDYFDALDFSFADGGKVDTRAAMRTYADGGRIVADSSAGVAPPGTMALNDPVDATTAASNAANPAPLTMPKTGAAADGSPDFSGDKLGSDVMDYFNRVDPEITGMGDMKNSTYQGKDGFIYEGYLDPGDRAATNPDYIRRYSGSDKSNGDLNSTHDAWLGAKADRVFNYDGSFRGMLGNKPDDSEWSTLLSFATSVASIASGNPAAFAMNLGGKEAGSAISDMLAPNGKTSTFGGVGKLNPARPVQSVGSGVDGAGGYANGGAIAGAGTGTSDSIPARVSDGEYIIPADVVQVLGTKFFDTLLDKHHMPAALQAMGVK